MFRKPVLVIPVAQRKTSYLTAYIEATCAWYPTFICLTQCSHIIINSLPMKKNIIIYFFYFNKKIVSFQIAVSPSQKRRSMRMRFWQAFQQRSSSSSRVRWKKSLLTKECQWEWDRKTKLTNHPLDHLITDRWWNICTGRKSPNVCWRRREFPQLYYPVR